VTDNAIVESSAFGEALGFFEGNLGKALHGFA